MVNALPPGCVDDEEPPLPTLLSDPPKPAHIHIPEYVNSSQNRGAETPVEALENPQVDTDVVEPRQSTLLISPGSWAPSSCVSGSSKWDIWTKQSSPFSRDSRGGAVRDRQLAPIFADVDGMKAKVRQSLTKPSTNVTTYYKDIGCWQYLARHQLLDHITHIVICLNAIWIAVDTDYNAAATIFSAHPVFQVVENAFCVFFLLEWLVRFMAFKRKCNCVKDGWFIFDTFLVIVMVLETWVLATVVALGGVGDSIEGGQGLDTSILRTVRLLRLTRMARMARLLRAVPELMILIKAMVAAMRSVFFALCLLVLLIYIFAIAFTQTTEGTTVGAAHFASVPDSMYTLLIQGTLLDNIGLLITTIGKENRFAAATFIVFVLLASLTVMNMLIGVLCEVVSVVAAVEKEHMAVSFVSRKMSEIVKQIDQDASGEISQAEFGKLLESAEATKALQEVGVDVVSLVDLADFIFQKDSLDGTEKCLTFDEFMEVVLQLRGTNTAKVKDIVTLQKFIRGNHTQTTSLLEKINNRLAHMEDKLRNGTECPHCSGRRPSVRKQACREGRQGSLSRSKSYDMNSSRHWDGWSDRSPDAILKQINWSADYLHDRSPKDIVLKHGASDHPHSKSPKEISLKHTNGSSDYVQDKSPKDALKHTHGSGNYLQEKSPKDAILKHMNGSAEHLSCPAFAGVNGAHWEALQPCDRIVGPRASSPGSEQDVGIAFGSESAASASGRSTESTREHTSAKPNWRCRRPGSVQTRPVSQSHQPIDIHMRTTLLEQCLTAGLADLHGIIAELARGPAPNSTSQFGQGQVASHQFVQAVAPEVVTRNSPNSNGLLKRRKTVG